MIMMDKMPTHASKAQLLAEIAEKGRDTFVADLAKNHDSIYDTSRNIENSRAQGGE